MPAQEDQLNGVVCDDRPAVRRTVVNVLTQAGFTLAGECDGFPAYRELVRATQPTVAVVTLPLVGMSGLDAVRLLRVDAPACEVVVLSHYDQLQVAAVEAGARALVPEDDPRALRAVLLAVAAERAATPGSGLPEQRAQAESLDRSPVTLASSRTGNRSTNPSS